MNQLYRSLTWVVLSWVGLALVSCSITDSVKPSNNGASSVGQGGQKITLDNAKRVSNLGRLSEGSFTAQSAWSLDGRWLALPSAYGVYLYDAQTWTQARFIDEAERVENIAFSPDGNWLAIHTRRAIPWHPETPTPFSDHVVRVWRTNDGGLAREFKGESWVGPAVFSPDNKYLATKSARDTARLWQMSDGVMAREFSLKQPNDSDPLTRAVFSPDWKTVATVSAGGQSKSKTLPVRIRLLNIADGSLARELTEAENNFDNANNLAFTGDGKMLVTTEALFITNMLGQPRSGTGIHVWQVSDGQLVREWTEQGVIFGVTASPEGSWVALADFEKTRIRRLSDASIIKDLNWAWTTVASPDGKLIASRNEDHLLDGIFALRVLRTNDGTAVKEIKEPFSVDGIVSSSDGSVLASGRLWRASNGALSNPVKLVGLTDHVDSVAVSRDNQWIATGGSKNVRLWQASDGKLVREIKGITGRVNRIAFSSDGTRLVASMNGQGVQMWQVSDGSLVRTFGQQTAVANVLFSPDGNTVAFTSGENAIQLWRANDGSLVREVQGGRRVMAFSPDSKLLATTDAGGTLGLWQTSDGGLVRMLETPDIVMGIAFSSDGNMLTVMYMSGMMRFWQVSNGSLVYELKDKVASAIGEGIAFSPDETVLVSASKDKPSVGLWGIPPTR
jgi:WD40 repeat protein